MKSSDKKLYMFQEQVPTSSASTRERNMAYMQRMAGVVWARHGEQRPAPRVVAGRGIPVSGGLASYQMGGSINRIVLARHQRNIHILLHELAHALVPYKAATHGTLFVTKFAQLLVEFKCADEGYLMLHFADRGIRCKNI